MMKKSLIAVVMLTAAFAAKPVDAQSLFKRLTDVATQAALSKMPKPESLADQVVGAATASKEKRGATDATEQPSPESEPVKPAPKARFPSDIKPSAEIAAQKQRFVEFSRYSCSDCEGGRGYDAWARQILNLTGNRAWEEKVGALGLGEAIEWRGQASDGALTVMQETTVAGLRCKPVKWILLHRSDKRTAEREGLFCFGRPDRYVVTETWVEVY